MGILNASLYQRLTQNAAFNLIHDLPAELSCLTSQATQKLEQLLGKSTECSVDPVAAASSTTAAASAAAIDAPPISVSLAGAGAEDETAPTTPPIIILNESSKSSDFIAIITDVYKTKMKSMSAAENNLALILKNIGGNVFQKNVDLSDQLEKDNSRLAAECDQLRRENARLVEQLRERERQINSLEQQVADHQHKQLLLTKLRATISNHRQDAAGSLQKHQQQQQQLSNAAALNNQQQNKATPATIKQQQQQQHPTATPQSNRRVNFVDEIANVFTFDEEFSLCQEQNNTSNITKASVPPPPPPPKAPPLPPIPAPPLGSCFTPSPPPAPSGKFIILHGIKLVSIADRTPTSPEGVRVENGETDDTIWHKISKQSGAAVAGSGGGGNGGATAHLEAVIDTVQLVQLFSRKPPPPTTPSIHIVGDYYSTASAAFDNTFASMPYSSMLSPPPSARRGTAAAAAAPVIELARINCIEIKLKQIRMRADAAQSQTSAFSYGQQQENNNNSEDDDDRRVIDAVRTMNRSGALSSDVVSTLLTIIPSAHEKTLLDAAVAAAQSLMHATTTTSNSSSSSASLVRAERFLHTVAHVAAYEQKLQCLHFEMHCADECGALRRTLDAASRLCVFLTDSDTISTLLRVVLGSVSVMTEQQRSRAESALAITGLSTLSLRKLVEVKSSARTATGVHNSQLTLLDCVVKNIQTRFNEFFDKEKLKEINDCAKLEINFEKMNEDFASIQTNFRLFSKIAQCTDDTFDAEFVAAARTFCTVHSSEIEKLTAHFQLINKQCARTVRYFEEAPVKPDEFFSSWSAFLQLLAKAVQSQLDMDERAASSKKTVTFEQNASSSSSMSLHKAWSGGALNSLPDRLNMELCSVVDAINQRSDNERSSGNDCQRRTSKDALDFIQMENLIRCIGSSPTTPGKRSNKPYKRSQSVKMMLTRNAEREIC